MSMIEMKDVVKSMTTGQRPFAGSLSKLNQENLPTS